MTLGTTGKRGPRRRQAVRPADRHRVAARRHVLHQRRLRRHARREVRQGRQVPDGLGHARRRIRRTRARTSGTRSTASRSARTASSSSSIAATGASRSSTRTASSSTCGRPACGRSRYAHLITTDQFLWESDGGTNRIVKLRSERQISVRLGRLRRAAGSVQRPALDHDRPGRQPVSGRSLQRPRAEVPAEAGRRHGEARRAGAAVPAR